MLLSVSPTVRPSNAQSPRAANPERPTVATHAYVVAAGYAELEQGARAFGVDGLREGTAWEFNLKLGLTDGLQLGVFGAGYLRTSGGTGVGDLGGSLKWGGALTARSAVALVPAVTVPTGDEGRGHGAGRALGSLVAVYSADLPAALHFDLNAGPVGIGAGRPQWFTSVGLARGGGDRSPWRSSCSISRGARRSRSNGACWVRRSSRSPNGRWSTLGGCWG